VYSAAVTKDQARISWDIAQQMVKRGHDALLRLAASCAQHSDRICRASFKPLAVTRIPRGLNPTARS
jgi:hypothetical protein